MSQSETIRKMNEMKLFGMVRSLEERFKSGARENLAPEELLALLVDDEYLHRKNNRLLRLLQLAKLRIPQAGIARRGAHYPSHKARQECSKDKHEYRDYYIRNIGH